MLELGRSKMSDYEQTMSTQTNLYIAGRISAKRDGPKNLERKKCLTAYSSEGVFPPFDTVPSVYLDHIVIIERHERPDVENWKTKKKCQTCSGLKDSEKGHGYFKSMVSQQGA